MIALITCLLPEYLPKERHRVAKTFTSWEEGKAYLQENLGNPAIVKDHFVTNIPEGYRVGDIMPTDYMWQRTFECIQVINGKVEDCRS